MRKTTKKLANAPLKSVVSGYLRRLGSYIQDLPSHQTATLVKASGAQAAVLHQQILVTLPTPL